MRRGAPQSRFLATGELATLNNVARASVVAMQAGADFIKNFHRQGRSERDDAVRARDGAHDPRVYERTGYAIGFKPAGGIRAARTP